MTIILGPQQQAGFNLVRKSKRRLVKVGGYAGVGKSTLLMKLYRSYLEDDISVICLGPTNKSVAVLRAMGVDKDDSSTIHRALYIPLTKEEEVVPFHNFRDLYDEGKLKASRLKGFLCRFPDLDNPGPMLDIIALVDEASMLTSRQLRDLTRVFKQVILFGDVFQLPPVLSRDVFNSIPTTILLTEIYRTAKENPIIRYATDIRNGNEPLIKGSWAPHIIHRKADDMGALRNILLSKAQLIAWRNNTRRSLIFAYRRVWGLPPNTVQKGETIIVTSNVYNPKAEAELLFYNGEMLTAVEDVNDPFKHIKQWHPQFRGTLMFPGKRSYVFYNFWRQDAIVSERLDTREAACGDFSYCVTAHKSQGGEWPIVAVFDERNVLSTSISKEMRQRWYYTAITRAKKQLIVLRVND